MARALQTAKDAPALQKRNALSFQEGPYQTWITRENGQSVLSLTGNGQTLRVPLLWAFGQGKAGQTYVFEQNGSLYESRLSYYNEIGKLDLTMGALGTQPASLLEAAGRRMESNTARDCFGCHATNAVSEGKLHIDSIVPGVGCESCHRTAPAHAIAAKSGRTGVLPRKLSELDAEEMSELCGRCHRTWAQIAADGPRGVNNVRFQPYRLTNSKCYDATDRRIGCTACHDPHGSLATDTAFYDAKCTACHQTTASAKARVCKVATKDCTSCHMPRIELPGAHAKFTDHQIRIVQANAPYPN